MIEGLSRWAIENRLVVFLLTFVLLAVGGFAFFNINVEAYPDPAPAIIEVIAQYPGSSAEEVERLVTIPLEVALAGMPGLETTRSKSLFGLSHLRNQFSYATSYKDARIEVLNRLALADLPSGVSPEIAPTSPIGEIYRYVLRNPEIEGKPVYSLADLKSIQNWALDREFRRVPRIADVVSFGGLVKRYEVQPDPDRLRRFDVTLSQIQQSIAESNQNAGGDYLMFPHEVQVVRGIGLLGAGKDPSLEVTTLTNPTRASVKLREAEASRVQEIRQITLAATNGVPIRVGDVVDGGPVANDSQSVERGVVIGHQTPLGKVTVSIPIVEGEIEKRDASGNRIWEYRPDVVEGVVLLRKGEQSLPALDNVHKKVSQLNTEQSKLLPGVKIETFDDRYNLIHRTTETVHENLVVGIVLVIGVLLIFLNHLRSALIVAVNIPLALLFAFALLYLRGRSANLLSLGAVDFGIIVDTSVIMVECVYRRLSQPEDASTDLNERILGASQEVQRALLFSTMIMVCALLPLFTMAGPEGQIFGPMADAYAFALGGALLLALTLSPVLCRTFLTNVKPAADNFFVRGLKRFYLLQLDWGLSHRRWVVGFFLMLMFGTIASLPFLGREFMPQLEEGNIYVRGTFPTGVSLEEVASKVDLVRTRLQDYEEIRAVLCQLGRPDDGTDPTSFFNAEIFIPLKNEDRWPRIIKRNGLLNWVWPQRSRSKEELIRAMDRDLNETVLGVDWNFSQSIRDNVMETLSGVKGENSVKIFGPDLETLEEYADQVAQKLRKVPGIKSVGVFSIMGQTNLEFAIDREKCSRWNVSVADVQNALATAVGGKSITRMVEGEKTFDITLRWPRHLRQNEEQILDIPVEVVKNRVVATTASDRSPIPIAGTQIELPAVTGSKDTPVLVNVPRRRLRDLIHSESRLPEDGGSFTRPGASTIAREQGQRLIAIKFSIRDRDLASAVADAQTATKGIIQAPYTMEWAGEFEEMQDAVKRLAVVVILAMILIIVLLYLAMRSLRDVVVVFSNVIAICMGGVWALFITRENFNISAGVGFISILGVGMMNGLILVSGFNARRFHGEGVLQAIREGVEQRVRPLSMTVLTAIFGMLPAALATKIGSQTQRPLAIVVVGGMIVTLLLLNMIPIFYSFYGSRTPPKVANLEH